VRARANALSSSVRARRRHRGSRRLALAAARHATLPAPSSPSIAAGQRASGRPRCDSVAVVLPNWSRGARSAPGGRFTRPQRACVPAARHGLEIGHKLASGAASGRIGRCPPGQPCAAWPSSGARRTQKAKKNAAPRGVRARAGEGRGPAGSQALAGRPGVLHGRQRRSKMNTPAQHPSGTTPRFQHPPRALLILLKAVFGALGPGSPGPPGPAPRGHCGRCRGPAPRARAAALAFTIHIETIKNTTQNSSKFGAGGRRLPPPAPALH